MRGDSATACVYALSPRHAMGDWPGSVYNRSLFRPRLAGLNIYLAHKKPVVRFFPTIPIVTVARIQLSSSSCSAFSPCQIPKPVDKGYTVIAQPLSYVFHPCQSELWGSVKATATRQLREFTDRICPHLSHRLSRGCFGLLPTCALGHVVRDCL